MRSRPAERGGSAGFTLIEVLVALVIAGLALAAVAGVFGAGLLGTQASGEVATALTLAEGEIAAAGAESGLNPGSSSGEFAGRYRWQLTVAPYDDSQDRDATRFDRPAEPYRLYRIAVVVAWREGLRRRQLGLATLRLGPAPP